MSHYAIGDIQGCLKSLLALLSHIQFDPHEDTLWLAGDLINRGPDSLGVLRFLTQLPKSPIVTLGNHDLHFLAVYFGQMRPSKEDTLEALLKAPDVALLADWLRRQSLIHHEHGYVLVHAGIAPMWSLPHALSLGAEVETALRADDPVDYFQHLYGNTPACWEDKLTGPDRLRVITNYFTRMRFCDKNGCLDLEEKAARISTHNRLMPWFEVPNRPTQDIPIIFGHWAALNGECHTPHCIAIDTGCVWGNRLTAFRLEDKQRFSVPALG